MKSLFDEKKRRMIRILIMAAVMSAFLIAVFVNFDTVNSAFNSMLYQYKVGISQEYRIPGNMIISALVLFGVSGVIVVYQGMTLRRDKQISLIEMELKSRIEDQNLRLMDKVKELDRILLKKEEAELHYRTLFQASADAIFVLCDGKYIFCNYSARILFGYDPDDEENIPVPESYFPEYQQDGKVSSDTFAQNISLSMEKGHYRFEWEFLRQDETSFYVDIQLTAVDIKEHSCVMMTIRDNSVNMDERQTLIDEKRTAESADYAKSIFLANMSHEIRTSLNGIIGMVEIAMESGLSETQAEVVSTIDNEAAMLLKLVNDILDFSKIEAGKFELETIDFNFRIMMEEMSRALSIRAAVKGLEFTLFISPDIPEFLNGDPGRLRQILLNLAGNALKFTNKGEVSVFAEPVSEKQESITIRFKVKDTGIGIPENKQAAVFDSYMQAEESTTRRYGGTGLGTTIAKQLTELMGGEIDLESEPGKGTTFEFTAEFNKQVKKNDPISIQDNLKSLKALIVGENSTGRSVIVKYLDVWGSNCKEVSSAKEALRSLRSSVSDNKPYDVVITELNLPDSDGFTLTEAIRKNKDLEEIPVIALTTAGIRGDARRCRESRIDGYLPRPILQNDLLSLIRIIVAQKTDPENVFQQELVTRHTIAEDYKSGFRIMLVEDYPTNQKLMLNHLVGAGYYTELAENGKVAVEMFDRSNFDLILMDIRMPVMDGYEATRRIRDIEVKRRQATGQENREAVVIIALTASVVSGNDEPMEILGTDRVVTKPVRKKELLSIIDTYALNSWKKTRSFYRGVTDSIKHDLTEKAEDSTTILLVEDTPTNQKIIMNHLTSKGLHVDLAENGQQGVEAFQQKSYDLVLMDIHMPVMDGYEAVRLIRKYENTSGKEKRVPVIAVTANASPGVRERCLDAGADDYEVKPLSRARLNSLIQTWVSSGEVELPEIEVEEAPHDIAAPLDYDRALNEFGNDQDLFEDVIKEFIGNVQEQIGEMSSALEAKESDVIIDKAHSIKGGAANLLAGDLCSAATHLEEIGRSGTFENAEAAIDRLAHELLRLKEYTGLQE